MDSAKEVLQIIAKKPGLTVFAAIRSQWGKGLDAKMAADLHIEGMYGTDYAYPSRCGGWGIFEMLKKTYELAEKLQQEGVFDAAFFFAHAAAEMIRRCEGEETGDDEEKVIQWAKGLDTIMSGAVKGWRKESGKRAKGDAATMVELLEKGERVESFDQTKWYPKTLKELRAWAK